MPTVLFWWLLLCYEWVIRVLLCVRLLWLIKGVYVRISCFVLWYIVLLFVFCVSDDVLFVSSFRTIGGVMYKSANYILVYRLTGDGYLNEQRWC